MRYREVDRLTRLHGDLPVHLKLQERLDLDTVPFHCVSWRTVYPRGRTNRQLYRLTESGIWSIPVHVALTLMREADALGWLDGTYDDPQIRHGGPHNASDISTELAVCDRRALFDSITCVEGEPEWGDDPLFAVVQVPDRTWRKIMIVDSERRYCTFRSTTIDEVYRRGSLRTTVPAWRVHNSMQDASASMIGEFLRCLEASA